RAVIGQQVSTAAARTHGARLAQRYGEPIDDPAGGLTRLFPDMGTLADAAGTPSAGGQAVLAMPAARRRTLVALARAIANGEVDLGAGADWELARRQLAQVPGLGPWTIELIAMRGLGDPDAFTATDLGVRQAAAALGLPDSPAALTRRAAPWCGLTTRPTPRRPSESTARPSTRPCRTTSRSRTTTARSPWTTNRRRAGP
ncbi:MAG TPA: DNA-3-methyladenine glycosylase 2 family protein, partial [Thermoplasmata archaeon]|nr:DNA-3-methyladenine glycosylase 2 family protein [Thermoplasmata archaeon]